MTKSEIAQACLGAAVSVAVLVSLLGGISPRSDGRRYLVKLLKHKDCTDVVFQRVHRHFSKSQAPSEYWAGYWWTIGTTGMWRSIHDTFFVPKEKLAEWEDYTPPKNLTLMY